MKRKRKNILAISITIVSVIIVFTITFVLVKKLKNNNLNNNNKSNNTANVKEDINKKDEDKKVDFKINDSTKDNDTEDETCQLSQSVETVLNFAEEQSREASPIQDTKDDNISIKDKLEEQINIKENNNNNNNKNDLKTNNIIDFNKNNNINKEDLNKQKQNNTKQNIIKPINTYSKTINNEKFKKELQNLKLTSNQNKILKNLNIYRSILKLNFVDLFSNEIINIEKTFVKQYNILQEINICINFDKIKYLYNVNRILAPLIENLKNIISKEVIINLTYKNNFLIPLDKIDSVDLEPNNEYNINSCNFDKTFRINICEPINKLDKTICIDLNKVLITKKINFLPNKEDSIIKEQKLLDNDKIIISVMVDNKTNDSHFKLLEDLINNNYPIYLNYYKNVEYKFNLKSDYIYYKFDEEINQNFIDNKDDNLLNKSYYTFKEESLKKFNTDKYYYITYNYDYLITNYLKLKYPNKSNKKVSYELIIKNNNKSDYLIDSKINKNDYIITLYIDESLNIPYIDLYSIYKECGFKINKITKKTNNIIYINKEYYDKKIQIKGIGKVKVKKENNEKEDIYKLNKEEYITIK